MESTSRRPAIGRDGKASISCPNCAARYKIAEENLETRVTCSQCRRTFYPLAAAQSRHAGTAPDNSKPIIYGIVAVAAIIIVGVIINALSGPPENDNVAAKVKEPEVIELGKNTREVKAVMRWAKAIGDKDEFNASMNCNMDAMQKKLGVETENPFSRAFGDQKKDLEHKILNALFAADECLVYRAYYPTYGRIKHEDMVAAKAGRVRLSLAPRDSSIIRDSAEVEVEYGYDSLTERFQVEDWHVLTMARFDYLLEKIDGKNPRKKRIPHELIGKAAQKEITFGGKKYEIEEAELVPLPHLKTTKPEDRKTIDSLIAQMVDLNASGIYFNRASNALELFGKAAVPRILNKMYETKLKSTEDKLVLNRLCRFLRNLSGWRFGFNPADMKEGSDIGGTEKERISALKQWYAWWGRYYDRDDWQNIDSDDEVELTTDQIEAKRAVEREKAKMERAARRKRARGRK